jgi:predicted P-loop ATPase/GTPase
MPIFADKYRILVSNHQSDIDFAKSEGMKKMYEDDSLEETTLKGIISSCENMLDDLDEGVNINDEDMKAIIYSDNVLIEIQQRLASSFSPTNIEGGHYSTDGNFAPMTDRIYCDDEHGNAL